MANSSEIPILANEEIMSRLHRMAFEVYERNYHAERLYVIGVNERGGYLASKMLEYLEKVSPLEIHYFQVEVDRETDPVSYGIQLSMDPEELNGQEVVVVDDVLYTGRTLLNVVAILLQAGPSSIQTAILVDRGHRSMPISPDFVGIELATTFHQHVYVEVDSEKEEARAYLL